MSQSQIEVAIIGGGAAGIAAARRLQNAGVESLIVEARGRLGGRAFTETDTSGYALDLGCGWLHSADRNPWVAIATAQGREIDRSTPPWGRPALTTNFPLTEQAAFHKAMNDLFELLGPAAARGHDFPVSDLVPRDGRWTPLLNAVGTYIAGAEFAKMSAIDFDRYEDSEINWRLPDGYGAMIAAHGEGLDVRFDSPVTRIDHSGKSVILETANGAISARQVIVTLPTTVLAESEALFFPLLPDKINAARGLPLGLDDKLFMSLEGWQEFEPDSRLFGATDRTATATYHLRPFGRPLIEAYFAGELAHELEAEGDAAFFAFAVDQLTSQFGNDFAKRVRPVRIHRWGADPFARGAYSYAVPGAADQRAVLAAPVDDRLFFAGEACSRHDFSTAHGAYLTGIAAADQVIAARA